MGAVRARDLGEEFEVIPVTRIGLRDLDQGLDGKGICVTVCAASRV